MINNLQVKVKERNEEVNNEEMLAFNINLIFSVSRSNIKKTKIKVIETIKIIDIFKAAIETNGQKRLNKVVIIKFSVLIP